MPLQEMELLLAAGLTPMAVIEGGTRYAAQVCGYGDELGTLEPGELADIIVVEGQPWIDIGALDKVKLVIKDGQSVYVDNEPYGPIALGFYREIARPLDPLSAYFIHSPTILRSPTL